jgi:hypothetical protein
MKAYNKRGCYRFGGTLKTKTIHGVRTGNHSNPHVVKAAKRACGGTVEGESARPRLDRPMRKRAEGGSVLSEDSRRRARDERVGALTDAGDAAAEVAKDGITTFGGTVLRGLSRGRLGRGAGRALQGLGVVSAPIDTAIGANKVHGRLDTARSIERGEPEPGQEDRKHGGAVKKGK